jgi:hypothetical protein
MGLFEDFNFGDIAPETFDPNAWTDLLANFGLDSGSEMLFDTLTGQWVDAAGIDPSLIDDAMGLFGDSTDFGDSADVGNVSGGPSGTSLSDTLRSRAADSQTEGTEAFDPSRMADPSASIASAQEGSGSDWMKALAKGLAGMLPAATRGLSGLLQQSPTGPLGGGSGVGMMSAPGLSGLASGGGGMVGAGSYGTSSAPNVGGLSSLASGLGAGGSISEPTMGTLGLSGSMRPDEQSPIQAVLSRLQAEAQRVGLQGPVDPGKEPVRFTPLTIQLDGARPIQATQGGQPPLTGLQRLALERRG